jgi:hypothetical protein
LWPKRPGLKIVMFFEAKIVSERKN